MINFNFNPNYSNLASFPFIFDSSKQFGLSVLGIMVGGWINLEGMIAIVMGYLGIIMVESYSFVAIIEGSSSVDDGTFAISWVKVAFDFIGTSCFAEDSDSWIDFGYLQVVTFMVNASVDNFVGIVIIELLVPYLDWLTDHMMASYVVISNFDCENDWNGFDLYDCYLNSLPYFNC